MMDNLNQKRRQDLESNIQETLALIKEYEDKRRLSNDPKEQRDCERQIRDLREIMEKDREELVHLHDTIVQQATNELRNVLRSEGLAEPAQATNTIAATIPVESSLLFRNGLCTGYPLEPSPDQYFVAQEFSLDRDDLLRALETAFQSFDLKPYRADKDILPGHILCKIAAKIQTTLFSVFELTHTQNRNVYLELGIAIGLRKPFILVKETDADVSALVQGLDYYNIRSYTNLQRELGDRVRQYLLNITQYRAASLPSAGSSATCIIAHGDYDMPPDFCLAVAKGTIDRGLTPILLGTDNLDTEQALQTAGITHQTISSVGKKNLDAVVEAIQVARFGIYRVDAISSPDAFLSLGIAIGLNRPWLLLNRSGTLLPSDLRGLSGMEFRSFDELGNQFARRFGDLLKRHT